MRIWSVKNGTLLYCFLAVLVVGVAVSMQCVGCMPSGVTTLAGFNTAPVARAGDDTTVQVGQTITLSGDGSSDADNDTLSYRWTKVSGPPVEMYGTNKMAVTVTLETVGVYEFSLTVRDSAGAEAADMMTVTVNAGGS